ncbi:MAG: hypothetical protein KatS3mg029_1040 [Saprospiraceae bacterium]|nr:MAG: hypothetical protein KatS3mg029_1040 [Saprospiraceae bacterium]
MKKDFQPLVTQMNAELEALLESLSSVPEATLRQRPSPQEWSVLEILQHIYIAERASIAYVRKKMQYPHGLKKIGLETRLRSLLLRFFLDAPFKFKAPAVVAEERFDPSLTLDTLKKEWKRTRQELSTLLEEMPPELAEKNIFKHALAGRLGLTGMLVFFEGHFRRHRRQIERTLNKLSAA